MKRKHKRKIEGVLNIVKIIMYVVVSFIATIFIGKSFITGEYNIKSIYNSVNLNRIEKSDTLYVFGDNTVNHSVLLNTKQIIESYFGLNVKISDERITLESDLFNNDGYLKSEKTLTRFDDNNDKIIITNYGCKNYENHNISGVSEGEFGNTVLVTLFDINSQRFKETVIHEISHNFGLDHCDNYNCLMYWSNSHLGKHDMCDDCRKKLLEKLD